MAAMMLMLINFDNNATAVTVGLTSLQSFLAATFDFPTFFRLFKAAPLFHSLAVFEAV